VPKKPLWKESPDEFFYRNRVTPLLPLSDIPRADKIEKIQAKWLDEAGVWNR
jgi:hypothetical protein